MWTLVKILNVVAIPTMLGFAVQYFLTRQIVINLFFMLAVGFGLGCGLVAQWMLCLKILKIQYDLFTIGAPLLMAALILLILSRTNKIPIIPDPKLPLPNDTLQSPSTLTIVPIIYRLLIIYIIFNVVFVFWRALTVPLLHWDTISSIAFPAKIFFIEKDLYQHQQLPYAIYPLQVPFLMSWTAFNLGYWDEQLTNIIFPFALLSFIGIYYAALKLFTDNKWAIAGVALLLSSNLFTFHATLAYRDFFTLYNNCTTIILLLMWHQSKNNFFLLMAGLFSGFTTFTKLEGMAYLIVHTLVFIYLLYHQSARGKHDKLKWSALFLIPSYALFLFYQIYKYLYNIIDQNQRLSFDFTFEKLNRILPIFDKLMESLFLSGNWSIIWFLLAVSLIVERGFRKDTALKALIVAMGLYFGVEILYALVTPHFIWLGGEKSSAGLSRVLLHFFPLSVAALILNVAARREIKRDRF